MIFPIGDDQVKGGVTPYISYGLILLNVLIFALQYYFSFTLGKEWLYAYFMEYGATPSAISSGENYLSLLTSIFIHGGPLHLIGNMVFLWVFGDNIESNIGNLNFLIFYLLGGLAATLLHVYMDPSSGVPLVGASGAIAAVLGAYLLIYPKSKIKLFVFLIVFVRVFRISALIFLIIWIAQQFIAVFLERFPIEGLDNNVAWWAHIGGFVFGVLFGLLLRKFGNIIALKGRTVNSTIVST